MLQPKQRISFAFYKFHSRHFPICANKRVYAAEYKSALHSHDFPQLWYCLRGTCRHIVGDQEYLCSKGSVIIVPTGVNHTFVLPDGQDVELITIDVSFEAFRKAPAQQAIKAISNLFLIPFYQELGWSFAPYKMLSMQSQQQMEELLSWFCLLNYAPIGSVKSAQIYEKLEEIFSLPEFAFPAESQKKASHIFQSRLLPVLQILSYINSHYAEKIEEESLLQEGGISRAVLYRYFKRIIGQTYSQYLQQLRVRRAYIYLKYTTYSLSYIADMCGFYDTQHMQKVFIKYEGESPNQQRAWLKKMYENSPTIREERRQILQSYD